MSSNKRPWVADCTDAAQPPSKRQNREETTVEHVSTSQPGPSRSQATTQPALGQQRLQPDAQARQLARPQPQQAPAPSPSPRLQGLTQQASAQPALGQQFLRLQQATPTRQQARPQHQQAPAPRQLPPRLQSTTQWRDNVIVREDGQSRTSAPRQSPPVSNGASARNDNRRPRANYMSIVDSLSLTMSSCSLNDDLRYG
jgi:hypothetical protein